MVGFQSRCVIGAVLSTGHARGLRLGGSRDLRLRRLRDQGAQWVLSGNVGGLITVACGLGGPHYATIALQSLRENFRTGLIGYATLAVIGLNR